MSSLERRLRRQQERQAAKAGIDAPLVEKAARPQRANGSLGMASSKLTTWAGLM